MKKILTAMAAVMLIAVAPFAQADDNQILVEFGFGIGKSASVSNKSDTSKWCKHRNRGGLTTIMVRARNNDRELHVARWWGDDGSAARCDRDAWAVGVGYVIDTISDDERGTEDAYASWTPGLAYTWGDDRGFKGEDSDNTNWRLTGNFQVFNRLAVGVPFTNGEDGNDGIVELAAHRYGTFDPDHGENFLTIGVGLRDFDIPNANDDGDRELTPPDAGDTTIINNDNRTVDITIIDNTETTYGNPEAQGRPE